MKLFARDPKLVFGLLAKANFVVTGAVLAFAWSPNVYVAVVANVVISACLAFTLPGVLAALSIAIPPRARSVGFSMGSVFVLAGMLTLPLVAAGGEVEQVVVYDSRDVPQPDPTRADESLNRYVFEKSVLFNNGDGSYSAGRIDLYRIGLGLRRWRHHGGAHALDPGGGAVDRAVLEHHSQPTGLPLVLAALPEHHGVFRDVSHNPHLLDRAIDTHPRDLSLEALRARAWSVMEPSSLTRLAELVDEFGWARSSGLGTDDLHEADDASSAGRIATLLIEAERDLPTDLDERVLRMGGEVIVVPAARMPTRSGIAATYRF